MLACPNCSHRLARRVTETGVTYVCPGCGGVATGLGMLRHEHVAQKLVSRVWQAARDAKARQGRPCPHCGRRMAVVLADIGGPELELDVCTLCACFWFDPGERGELPRTPRPTPSEPELSPEAREAVAMVQVEAIRKRYEEASEAGKGKAPDEAWKWVPGLFGLPVECDVPAVGTWPWITWGTGAVCVLVTVGALLAGGVSALKNVIWTLGFVPEDWHRLAGATVVSGFFLHGGIWHLVGNTYFLMIFGDNVEDHLGRRRYVLLLLAAHVAGTVLHGLIDPRSAVPVVGASAGISGVIAYYAVTFPRAKLGICLRYWWRFHWVRLPAWMAFLIWAGLQFFVAWQQISGFTNVSALAHLGGACVGLAAAAVARMRRRDAVDPAVANKQASSTSLARGLRPGPEA